MCQAYFLGDSVFHQLIFLDKVQHTKKPATVSQVGDFTGQNPQGEVTKGGIFFGFKNKSWCSMRFSLKETNHCFLTQIVWGKIQCVFVQKWGKETASHKICLF